MKTAQTETLGRKEQHASNTITGQTQQSEDKMCEDLHQLWVEAAFSRMKRAFQVDNVTGSVGPLYYCEVKIAGQPVEALINSGSSTTVMTFRLLQRNARDAQLSVDVLEKPDVILRNYNQHPLRIEAFTKLEVTYKGKRVLAPIYIDSENKPTESCKLGTNLLLSLGILSVSKDVKIRGGYKEAVLAGPREATTSSVKLVKSKQIPARSGVVLRLTVDAMVEPGGTFYFLTMHVKLGSN